VQFELPSRPAMTALDPFKIYSLPNMTKALALCQAESRKPDSHFYGDGGIVKNQAQWSRIFSETSPHCFPHEKLNTFMDLAGNEAPLLYLLHSRGYELSSLRLRETETERALRIANEKLEQERLKNRVLMEAINGRTAA